MSGGGGVGDTSAIPDSFSSVEEVIDILTSSVTVAPDPRLDPLLEAIRRQWVRSRGSIPWLRPDDVDDVVQDAFVRLLSPGTLANLTQKRAEQGFASTRQFQVWLFVLLRNTATDRWRAAATGERLQVDPPEHLDEWLFHHGEEVPVDLEAQAIRRQYVEGMLAVITTCPIATLHFIEGLSDAEIAARLDTTRDAVAGKLKRLRPVLRQRLEDEDRS